MNGIAAGQSASDNREHEPADSGKNRQPGPPGF